MIYATVADMVVRFTELEMIQLTDLVNIPPSTVDEASVEVKLADAAAVIDGYVGQVYKLPLRGCMLPPVQPGDAPNFAPPPVLTRLTCDIARYFLYSDLAPEHEVAIRYKSALKELDSMVNGKTLLSCPYGGSAGELVGSDAVQGEGVTFWAPPRRISDYMPGWP